MNELTPGTILVFQTNEGRWGKMQVRANSEIFTFRWKTWNTDGSLHAQSDYLKARHGRFYDLNLGRELETPGHCDGDFMWMQLSLNERNIAPNCKAAFGLYHLE